MSALLISEQNQNPGSGDAPVESTQAQSAPTIASSPRLPEQYKIVEELERYLGDPRDAHSLFSFARSMELDEREEYPEQACRMLDEWGLASYYVPEAAGGRLSSYEQLLALLRVVSRRDFTVGFAYSILSLLGSTPVWVGGTLEQQAWLAELIKRGGQVALAYNERAHGSDFMATELEARASADGFILSGEKWLTGNAVRASAMTVIARTSEGGGPRGFSLFLIDKTALDAAAYEHLPRLKTLGVRGAQVSGVRFKNSLVRKDALIGTEGSGLEQTLKGFQITRTIIPGLSLGAADTALRATLDFALGRRLYGASVFEIPQARRQVVEAFIDLLICECLAVACSRALHQTPEQMRLYSAVVKFFVQTTVEEMLQSLSVILGARQYLREGHWSGIFQKLMRDSIVVRYHFNTALNLTTVAIHLRDLAAHRAKSATDAETLQARLAAIFDLSRGVEPFNPANLRIYTRGRDDFMYGLNSSLARIQGLGVEKGTRSAEVLSDIERLVSELLKQVGVEDARRQELEEILEGDYATSPELFEQAKRYCTLNAAAACVHMWLYNREGLGEFFAGGEWLVLCLHRLLNRLRPTTELWPRTYSQNIAAELVKLYDEDKLFSILPLRLAH